MKCRIVRKTRDRKGGHVSSVLPSNEVVRWCGQHLPKDLTEIHFHRATMKKYEKRRIRKLHDKIVANALKEYENIYQWDDDYDANLQAFLDYLDREQNDNSDQDYYDDFEIYRDYGLGMEDYFEYNDSCWMNCHGGTYVGQLRRITYDDVGKLGIID